MNKNIYLLLHDISRYSTAQKTTISIQRWPWPTLTAISGQVLELKIEEEKKTLYITCTYFEFDGNSNKIIKHIHMHTCTHTHTLPSCLSVYLAKSLLSCSTNHPRQINDETAHTRGIYRRRGREASLRIQSTSLGWSETSKHQDMINPVLFVWLCDSFTCF